MIVEYLLFLLLISLNPSQPTFNPDECNVFHNINDCYFYSCLDARYQCGPNNALVTFSHDFCELFVESFPSQLTADAAWYFITVNQCMMNAMKKQFSQPTISSLFRCADLQEAVFNIHIDCMINYSRDNGTGIFDVNFCSILCENLQQITLRFLRIDPSTTHLIQFLKRILQGCDMKTSESIAYTVPMLLLSVCDQKNRLTLTWDKIAALLQERYQRRIEE